MADAPSTLCCEPLKQAQEWRIRRGPCGPWEEASEKNSKSCGDLSRCTVFADRFSHRGEAAARGPRFATRKGQKGEVKEGQKVQEHAFEQQEEQAQVASHASLARYACLKGAAAHQLKPLRIRLNLLYDKATDPVEEGRDNSWIITAS